MLHYPDGIESKISDGIIKSIEDNNYTIKHLCDSNYGSSGGPLISLDSFKVIGIHKGSQKLGNWNLGSLIKEPIEEFFKNQEVHEDEKTIKYRIKTIIEKLGGEENKEIGFDFSLLKKD